MLDPDPVHYFHRHFKKYPALEIDRGDSARDYLAFVNADPGGNPADAVGTNWWACVIVPPSSKWFVHALRDSGNSGGHLWIPSQWIEKDLDPKLETRKIETHCSERRFGWQQAVFSERNFGLR